MRINIIVFLKDIENNKIFNEIKHKFYSFINRNSYIFYLVEFSKDILSKQPWQNSSKLVFFHNANFEQIQDIKDKLLNYLISYNGNIMIDKLEIKLKKNVVKNIDEWIMSTSKIKKRYKK